MNQDAVDWDRIPATTKLAARLAAIRHLAARQLITKDQASLLARKAIALVDPAPRK